MLILNLILCLAALTAAVFTHRVDNPIKMVVLSYVCFSLSPIFDMLDIITRAKKDDVPGILDIYPTFFVGYLILLVVITIIIIAAVLRMNAVERRGE